MVPTLMSEPHSPTLFETPNSEPLAARMRPRTLAEYIGQDHIVGPGRLLRRAIEADQLSSLIFYGPPGTGKTTLARVIANSTRARFAAINAVLGGVKDIREAVAAAQACLARASQGRAGESRAVARPAEQRAGRRPPQPRSACLSFIRPPVCSTPRR